MKGNEIDAVMRIVRRVTKDMKEPYVGRLAHATHDPFLILIATILSLRTRDNPTEIASERLFALARTPEKMAMLSREETERAIRPVMFSGIKAQNILKTCQMLVDKFDSRVPADIEELDTLPGVGRKTANLVVTLGYGQPGICVDTHVHRVTNRWGYVHAKSPDDTEMALRAKLPKKYWIEINGELVKFGQNICMAVLPKCSACPLLEYCDRVGVTRSR